MGVISWAKHKVSHRVVNLVKAEAEITAQKTVEYLLPQLINFQNSNKEDRQSYHDHSKDPTGNAAIFLSLKDRLLAAGIPVEELAIDIADFEHWLREFPDIKEFYSNIGNVAIEKCLEHYLTFRYLNISKGDIYIDIASAGSPWARVLNTRGIKSYDLDLVHPSGVHGISIGADAGNTNLPKGFCTAMSAQCAYECFQGDSDIKFVTEAGRILKPKGRYGIVPLYLENTHFVVMSPYCDLGKVQVESEARKVWRDDEYKVPFGRFYSPESFKKRVYSNLPEDMAGKVIYFNNLPEVNRHFDGQCIYCFFMFCCQKS